MKKLLFILLLLINNLFAETPTELDLQMLKDLGIDSSFLNEPSLQRAYKEYSQSKNIAHYDGLFKKSALNSKIVKDEIEKEKIPFSAIFIPLIESSFVNQINKGGPSGLWQFMPQTAKNLKLKNDDFVDERLDLVKSTDAASTYLRKYYKRFDRWYLAILAYNAGEGRIIDGIARASLDKYLEEHPTMADDKVIRIYKIYLEDYKKNKKGMDNLYNIYRWIGEKENYFDLAYLLKNNAKKDYLPKTTIEYLHKVVALSMIANRDLFKNLDRKSKYNLEKVKADKSLRLKDISDAIGMNYAEFKEINKHFKKEVLPKNAKLYNLYVPHTKLDLYNSVINNLKEVSTVEVQKQPAQKVKNEPVKKAVENKKTTSNKIEHIVKEGDTLESISKKYKTSVAKLKKDNKKKSNFLKIGEKIEIYK
ncbi:lytic transglycosylase domain-containing protein [Aliarcobacter butzleri]|uniref:Transglycosylase SLT domain-containing protein n=2 Tax=Aliarcobacter butzleri TaxID=28197 RepID=A0AAW7PX65_9BACT|nr:lytic transglycosylase domain-containing protein [Aliarcobacter butzleri]KLE01257.1 lytic transglycosylase [Aliarcobacter butzleri L348]MCG3666511.1 transglycosylase SLT domain-containing protein [Aliarcobacter butzleri]MDN5070566.1 transglycosylase SLT domain-containing protein [Aliarcobacter butzleri]